MLDFHRQMFEDNYRRFHQGVARIRQMRDLPLVPPGAQMTPVSPPTWDDLNAILDYVEYLEENLRDWIWERDDR
jgi:hypothetical protein